MTEATGEQFAVPLYKHTARKDWGVAILLREEDDGKRGYLFEDGQERTMANGYHQLMRRVEQPSVDQVAFYEKQRALLERSQRARSSGASGQSFLAQLERLHETYPDGLSDPKWIVNVRGEGADQRTPRHRNVLIQDAQKQLSAPVLDGLLKSQSYAQIWGIVTALLGQADLVPTAQIKKLKSASNDGLGRITNALRELLHGTGPYDRRLDVYLAALGAVSGTPPPWELGTALSALVHPSEHVCILPTAFRQQLKALSVGGSVPAHATSAAYGRLLGIARVVATKLKEQGQEPRDLFDVYDFIRLTPNPPKKSAPRPKKAPARAAEASSEASSDSED